jgi:hypothetical protein
LDSNGVFTWDYAGFWGDATVTAAADSQGKPANNVKVGWPLTWRAG